LNYRSIKTLNQHIFDWIPKLPRDIDLIVGIPRSGLLVANLLALYLNLPLADVESFTNSRIIGSGHRANIENPDRFFQPKRKVLIIDDSVVTGTEIQRVKKVIQESNLHHTIYYAAVYLAPGQEDVVDFFYELVPMPRVFEWNFMHHGDIGNWCIDVDGVLCRDPTDEENDDGDKYLQFLKTAEPLILPSLPLGWLITCRLEKYRQITEEWLQKHGIKYKDLFMMNFPTKEARIASGSHASFKASHYKRTSANLFIESSLKQAMEIAKLSGKYVLCTETRDRISPSYIARKIQNQQQTFRLVLQNPKEIPIKLVRFVGRRCLQLFKNK